MTQMIRVATIVATILPPISVMRGFVIRLSALLLVAAWSLPGQAQGGVTITPSSLSVAEGGVNHYTVTLATDPSGMATVTPASADTSLATVSAALTFGTSDWNTAQTVTVTGVVDTNAVADSTSITHAVTGYGTINTADPVMVTVAEQSTISIMDPLIMGINNWVMEGGNVVFPLTISPPLSAPLTLSYTVTPGTASARDYTVPSPARVDLTFGQTEGEISIETTDDGYPERAPGLAESFTVTLMTLPGDAIAIIDTTASTATGNVADVQGGLVSVGFKGATGDAGDDNLVAAVYEVDEGESATIEIVLKSPNLEMNQDWELDEMGFRFAYQILSRHRTSLDSCTEMCTADSNDYATISATTRTGNIGPRALVNPVRDASYGPRVIALTVRTVEDADIEPDEVFELRLVDPGEEILPLRLAGQIVRITILNDDDPGVSITKTALTIEEGRMPESGTSTYAVVLDTDIGPSDTVVVTPTAAPNGHDLTLTPATLSFTTFNWNIPQMLTVAAREDGDADDDTATISHAVSGYGAVNIANQVMVTITDNDSPGVTVTETARTIGEGGGTSTYAVRLNTVPDAGATVTVSTTVTPSGNDLTLMPAAALTFTTANWSDEQMVTVEAGEDDDTANDTATITHTVTGYGDVNTANPVVVTITDDDSLLTITGDAALTETDADVAYTYTVTRDGAEFTDPTTVDVTLAASVSNSADVTGANADVTLSADTVTFAAGDDEQTFTVTVIGDNESESDETFTLVTSGGGGASVRHASAVTVTLADDDAPTPGVTVTKTTLTIEEGRAPEAGASTYAVSLNTVPDATVTVSATVTPSGNDLTLTPAAALTFTTANWNTEQMLTVEAGEDGDTDNDTATITHTVTGYGMVTAAASVVVTVTDDDMPTPGIEVNPGSLTVDERASSTYTVSLAIQPAANVTVALAVTPSSADLTVTPSSLSLTFTNVNWNTAQTVTVDPDVDDNITNDPFTITHTATSGDTEYDGITATLDVVVTDFGAIVVGFEQSSYTVAEHAETVELCASVTNPADRDIGDETSFMLMRSTADGTGPLAATSADYTPSTGPLTAFTTAQPRQCFTVGIVNDGIEMSDSGETFTVMLTEMTASTTPTGLPITIRPATATVTIDELMAVIAPTALTMPEGTTGIYTVALNASPSDDVTITPTITPSSDNTEVTLSPASLTFTDTNWNTRQTVTVISAKDDDLDADSATISHMANGTPIQDPASVVVTVTDIAVDAADLDALNRVILPEVARAITDRQTDAIAWRVREAGVGGDGNSGGHFNLAGQSSAAALAAQHARTLADDDLDMKRLLGDADFALPVGGGGGGGAVWSELWGAGDYRNLGGESSDGNTKWDGDLFSVHLGFDARLRPDLLAGLMVSHSDADLDYEYPSAAGEQKGDWELDMTGINPYIGWKTVDGHWDMWATIGYGSGDLEITPDDDNVESLSSDVTLSNIGVGGSNLIRKNGNTGHELRVNAEAFHTRAEIDGADRNAAQGNTPELWDLDIDATRLRLMLESRHPRTTAGGARLTPSAEIGMRHDNGDGRIGTGAEIGGGIHYNDAQRGLTLEANARALLAHSGDYDDWGISGKIYLQPGTDGQGLSLSLTPGYGNTAAGAQKVWNNGLLETATAADAPDLQARLDARVGYGLNLHTGLLTPYTEMTLGEARQSYRLGLQWGISESFDLKLTGEHIDNESDDNAIKLDGEVRF